MSRCPPRCCEGCRDEVRQERSAKKAENQRKETCSAGPSPEISHDSDCSEDNSGDTTQLCIDTDTENLFVLLTN